MGSLGTSGHIVSPWFRHVVITSYHMLSCCKLLCIIMSHCPVWDSSLHWADFRCKSPIKVNTRQDATGLACKQHDHCPTDLKSKQGCTLKEVEMLIARPTITMRSRIYLYTACSSTHPSFFPFIPLKILWKLPQSCFAVQQYLAAHVHLECCSSNTAVPFAPSVL